jgi:hypothetical protein
MHALALGPGPLIGVFHHFQKKLKIDLGGDLPAAWLE